ncbi:MAG: hypothetical protein A2W90_02445 [Bacteroidetes bacterium GWF2_42_66]|nr:MAG: hypothetical protein A2W92_08520 [Bacteroidetes bacterium GWA2_42_15]OFY01210.1 MAG: hypothetical protein A2W89_15930 [Bacteroidetes bacterium GWE2_42_39]OFY42053.1 MAG: hypothetical protein A2W90_02445 [Bacteroidetes bacterium GWF2_42_66]HBL77744.1 hypothetical protein [Prolixibacteraceae bacterium]HCB62873.1 hypothetical protein [Bacteroidales bacterium]
MSGNGHARIVYEVDKRELTEAITETLTELVNTTAYERFRDRLVSVDVVAQIHDVNRQTVIKYANAQLIPATREGKLYKFVLADALQFDFRKLRTKKL